MHLFADRRILLQLFLGFSGGLPLALTGTTLSYWFAKLGISLTTIGIFSVVALPYSLRFLWAPVVDHYPLPFLTKRFGQRRSWALLTQAGLLVAISALASCDPVKSIYWVAFWAFCVALISATQDLVLDAYRTEIFDKEEYGAGASTYVFGHRFGLMIAKTGAIFLSISFGWNFTYHFLAVLMIVGIIAVLLSAEPVRSEEAEKADHEHDGETAFKRIFHTLLQVILDFAHRQKWVALAAFLMLYKLSDNLLGIMVNPFYISLGFADSQIAMASQFSEILGNITGGLLAGAFISRFGLFRVLVVCGVMESVSNLIFIIQAYLGQELPMLYATMIVENITSAMAVTAFVAFLSTVCSISFTATHYAMMVSLSAMGRNIFATSSGWIAEHFGWINFFSVTALAGIPSLLLLFYIGPKLLEQRTQH